MNIILPQNVAEKLHKEKAAVKKQRQAEHERHVQKMFRYMQINGVIYR